MTEWRPIEGWPYEVSSAGEVRRIGGRVLRGRPNKAGYLRVGLSRGGKVVDYQVSRLVCAAFHGPPPDPKDQADHFPDKTVTNNAADNLRWLSQAENLAGRTIAFGVDHANAVLTPELVREIRASGESVNAIARRLGRGWNTIWCAKHRKTWRHVA